VNGLIGARVVVVDDDPEEALPILKAFSKIGVPSVFFDGRPTGLPRQADRLTGVRLAVLDMDLIGGGADDKSKVAALVKVLSGILSSYNGPYAVVAWTKHLELVEVFERYLFEQPDLPNPIFVTTLEKAACKKTNGFDLRVVAEELKKSLDEGASPLFLLQSWEGKAFDAATRVTNELSNITDNSAGTLSAWRQQWKSEVVRLMRALAEAQAGKHLDKQSCFRYLYDALNPLHADALERGTTSLSLQLTSKADEILNATPECGPDRKAKLNTMLHLSFDAPGKLVTGDIYMLSRQKLRSGIPTIQELLSDSLQLPKDECAATKLMSEIGDVVQLIAVEISAVCDYAQRNVRVPRFLIGLLVPVDHSKKLKQAEFLWHFGPIFLDHPPFAAGRYNLYLSARHMITFDPKVAAKLRAVARLRIQVLTHLQAWFSQRASRPGVVMLI
jgi:hypothetical protein